MSLAGIKRINTGSRPDDGTGDTLREAFIKVNDNFEVLGEAVGALGAGGTCTIGTPVVNQKGRVDVGAFFRALEDALKEAGPATTTVDSYLIDRDGVVAPAAITRVPAEEGDFVLVSSPGTPGGNNAINALAYVPQSGEVTPLVFNPVTGADAVSLVPAGLDLNHVGAPGRHRLVGPVDWQALHYPVPLPEGAEAELLVSRTRNAEGRTVVTQTVFAADIYLRSTDGVGSFGAWSKVATVPAGTADKQAEYQHKQD